MSLKRRAVGDSRADSIRRPLYGTVVLWAVLAAACGVLFFGLDFSERVLVTMLIYLVAVVGIGVFSGSGVISFGHVMFMGLAAYCSGLLTTAVSVKETALPDLSGWLMNAEVSPAVGIAISVAFVSGVALIVGVPIVRLPRNTASIATLGLLIVVNAVLLGAADLTRGAQTFYGVPPFTTLPIAAAFGAAAILVARLFRESRWGLGLRAANDDELAAGAMGVNIAHVRLIAWVISGALVGASGALLGHYLGAFSPKEFYFGTTFVLLAMLIVGGIRTVTGAAIGALVVSVLLEWARRLEPGVTIGPIHTPEISGLSTLALGAALLVVMYRRPLGLFGQFELDEVIRRLRIRRQAAASGDDGASP